MALLATFQPGNAQQQAQAPLVIRNAAAAAQQMGTALELLVQEMERLRARVTELEKQCGDACKEKKEP